MRGDVTGQNILKPGGRNIIQRLIIINNYNNDDAVCSVLRCSSAFAITE